MHYKPKRVAISEGYVGCHATIAVYKQTKGVDVDLIGLNDEYRSGDLIWLETPLNPTGESRQVPVNFSAYLNIHSEYQRYQILL